MAQITENINSSNHKIHSHDKMHRMVLNPCIEHIYMFWNIRNLILWREAVKKRWIFSGNYKYGELILGQSEKKYKIQSHFGIFGPVIVEGQLYDDAASHAIKFICELFGNIRFFYSMKSCLYFWKNIY